MFRLEPLYGLFVELVEPTSKVGSSPSSRVEGDRLLLRGVCKEQVGSVH